jgi:TonB family protein
VWFKLGDSYRGAKRYQEAVTAYNQAIQIRPFGPYYNNLGEVNGKLGNFDDAVQAYRNAVRVDPPNAAQYYFNIGAVRTNAGDLEDANEAFDEAIRTDPQLASPYYFKGINLLSEARIVQGTATVPDGAIGAFRKYLDLQPDGDYATMSRQLIDFLGRTIVTTYSRTEAPGSAADDRRGHEFSEAGNQVENDGLVLRRIEPSYPPLARSARVQGTVILDAIIGKDGTVLRLSVLSGNPLLVGSAISAVQRWQYKTYIVGNQPVKVRTQVQVNFMLSGDAAENLSLQTVLQLLQGGMNPERVTSFVQVHKVSFELTESRERRVRAAGGDDSVVLAIRNNRQLVDESSALKP